MGGGGEGLGGEFGEHEIEFIIFKYCIIIKIG